MMHKLINSVRRRIRIKKAWLKDEIHGYIDRAFFKEKEGGIDEKRKIIFHSVVWGDDFLHPFFSYTIPSLLQDGNIPQLARDGFNLKFCIYTHPEQYQEISKQYESCLASLGEYMAVSVIPLDEMKDGWWRDDTWHYMTGALIDQIERCLKESAMMFDARPDTIYGNGSISNAVNTVQGKNVCFAAAHPRLDKASAEKSDAFAALKNMERCYENDELVGLAFEHAHATLRGSFDNEDCNMTYGGLSIRKITDNMYTVIHNLPMIWVANFTKDDLRFFKTPWSTWDDRWDHRWANLLLRQNRLKVAGSSDFFFCVEPMSDRHRALPMEKGLLNNDKFQTRRQRRLHNYVFNSFCSVWRGRSDRSKLVSGDSVQQSSGG